MLPAIQRRFYTARLVQGGVLFVGGVAMVTLSQFVPFVPPIVLAPALLAVPIGVLVTLRARGYECARCRREFRSTRFMIKSKDRRAAKAAMKSGDTAGIIELISTEDRPFSSLEAKCTYCPGCHGAAVIKITGWPAAHVADPEVPRLLNTVLAVNKTMPGPLGL